MGARGRGQGDVGVGVVEASLVNRFRSKFIHQQIEDLHLQIVEIALLVALQCLSFVQLTALVIRASFQLGSLRHLTFHLHLLNASVHTLKQFLLLVPEHAFHVGVPFCKAHRVVT